MDETSRSGSPSLPAGDVAALIALSGASREKADAFLDEQIRLAREQTEVARLQAEDLRDKDAFELSHLRWRQFDDRVRGVWLTGLALLVMGVIGAIALVLWNASQASGLVIESFDVPPALLADGLTGPVVASKLLDRLNTMQAATDSSRAASTFQNDWTGAIKLAIPDTGISLGEAYRYLTGWLGHQQHLEGAVYRSDGTITLTVRLGGVASSFTGKPEALDDLVQQAAEAVFRRAQTYRYAAYLSQHGRPAESDDVARDLALHGPPSERGWAYVGLAISAQNSGRYREARQDIALGRQADPNLPNLAMMDARLAIAQGHLEALLRANKEAIALLRGKGADSWNANTVSNGIKSNEAFLAENVGDPRKAMEIWGTLGPIPGGGGSSVAFAAIAAIQDHDFAAAELFQAQAPDRGDALTYEQAKAYAMGQWRQLIAITDQVIANDRQSAVAAHQPFDEGAENIANAPFLAEAHARLGEDAKADAILRALPPDCDPCTLARGRIDGLRYNWKGAAWWFAIVAARTPDLPEADFDWGEMLLRDGKFDEAIAKFAAAHAKGPHFADPLEMWGEALIAKNRSDLALAKFTEAAKYAPNWGRLHLKWGEALMWSGHRDEAKTQFGIARGLGLSMAETSQLQKLGAM